MRTLIAECSAEWLSSAMTRRNFPKRVKLTAWERCNGLCEGCTRSLAVGDFHYDHVVPDGMGGEPTLENCEVLCRSCHALKTNAEDIPRIAKAKRNEAKHIGAHRSRRPMAGSRESGWRKPMNGKAERR